VHDAELFRALYTAHYGTVCRYLARRVDAAHVEDVAAETFLVAWRRRTDVPARAAPWLLNTAAKCLANARRSDQRAEAVRRRLDAITAPHASSLHVEVERGAHRRALVAALAGLAERDRELVLLRHWDGLAPRDLAVVLEISPMVARARLSRAERRLREALADALAHEDLASPTQGPAPCPTPSHS
jgi:RNA polymerase sigma-70 factor (ECF subfamily)